MNHRRYAAAVLFLLMLSGCSGAPPGPGPNPPPADAPHAPASAPAPTSGAPAPANPVQAPSPPPAPAQAPENQTQGQAPAQTAQPCSPAPPAQPNQPCSPAQTAPASPEAQSPTPGRPALERVWFAMFEEHATGGSQTGEVTLSGLTATVPAEPFWFYARVSPPPSAEWSRAIQATGAEGPPEEAGLSLGLVALRFGAGAPGTELTVTLPATANHPAQTYRLTRAPQPRVTVEIETDDGWQPVAAHEVYPTGPLSLRLRFTAAMDRDEVERLLRTDWRYSSLPVLPPEAALTWQDDSTLLISLSDPPPVLLLNLQGAPSTEGLVLIGQVPAVHLGEPPQLVSIDPSSGQERVLTTLPAEVTSVDLSPDGKHVLVSAHEVEVGVAGTGHSRWLIDIPQAEWKRLEDSGEHSVFLGADGAPRSFFASQYLTTAVSPDRSRIAALQWNRASPDSYHPFDLVVLDADGTEVQRIPDFVRVYGPPKDWPMSAPLAWSPEGARVASLSHEPGAAIITVADLQTGEVKRLTHLTADPYSLPVFSWDGRHFLVGRHLLGPDGQFVRELPIAGRFSPDGQWLLSEGWGQVHLAAVATGTLTDLGEGLPAGWTPDGQILLVRWAHWRHRYVPFWML